MGAPDTHRWPAHRDKRIHQAFYAEFRIRPTATSLVVASVICGVWALILGEGASRAFTVIGGGPGGSGALIAHLMGAFLLIGGLISLAGSLRLGTLVELLGLVFASAGWFIYGGGVLIGLGANGLIAGSLALILAVGSAGRVLLLTTQAKRFFNGDH